MKHRPSQWRRDHFLFLSPHLPDQGSDRRWPLVWNKGPFFDGNGAWREIHTLHIFLLLDDGEKRGKCGGPTDPMRFQGPHQLRFCVASLCLCLFGLGFHCRPFQSVSWDKSRNHLFLFPFLFLLLFVQIRHLTDPFPSFMDRSFPGGAPSELLIDLTCHVIRFSSRRRHDGLNGPLPDQAIDLLFLCILSCLKSGNVGGANSLMSGDTLPTFGGRVPVPLSFCAR